MKANIKTAFFTLCLCCCWLSAGAVNYYVKTTGNDSWKRLTTFFIAFLWLFAPTSNLLAQCVDSWYEIPVPWEFLMDDDSVNVYVKYEGDTLLYPLTTIDDGSQFFIEMVHGRNTFYNPLNADNCPPEPVIEYLLFLTFCRNAELDCFIPSGHPGSICSATFECSDDIHFWIPPPISYACNNITIDFPPKIFFPFNLVRFGISYVTVVNFTSYIGAKALLGGAYSSSNLMNTNLNTNFILPNLQPFNQPPWYYNGTEAVGNFPANTTDWVLLELRSKNNIDSIVYRRAALIMSNGDIIDTDGCNTIAFGANYNEYYVALRHRNHLDVISSEAIFLQGQQLDFTNPANVLNGESQMLLLNNGLFGLKPGDIDANGVITYSDFNAYKQQVAASNSYNKADCNLDGTVNLNDFNLIRANTSSIGISSIRY